MPSRFRKLIADLAHEHEKALCDVRKQLELKEIELHEARCRLDVNEEPSFQEKLTDADRVILSDTPKGRGGTDRTGGVIDLPKRADREVTSELSVELGEISDLTCGLDKSPERQSEVGDSLDVEIHLGEKGNPEQGNIGESLDVEPLPTCRANLRATNGSLQDITTLQSSLKLGRLSQESSGALMGSSVGLSLKDRELDEAAFEMDFGKFELKGCWWEDMKEAWGQEVKTYRSEKRHGFSEKHLSFMGNGQWDTVINPNSSFRVGWEMSSMVLIAYDGLFLPFNFAFTPPPFWLTSGMDMICLIFWTADMMQGFFLGYYKNGQYVTDNRRILLHYFMTWFIVDVIVVVPEWLTLIAGTGDYFGGFGRFLKGARAIRILRLLRLLKLQRVLNKIYDFIDSEYTFILVNLIQLLVLVLVMNHVIACVWFFIGRKAMEASFRNWIEVANVQDAPLGYKYTTSLHWSMTQFTPASMDVSARNTPERIFSIVVLFFAMVAFSTIVGKITSSMNSLHSRKSEEMKQFWMMRKFLRQRSVSKQLTNRILKYLDFWGGKQKRTISFASIKIFDNLSEALFSDLAHELHAPVFLQHPFYQIMNWELEAVMHRFCRFCIAPQCYGENELVFNAGQTAKSVFFIKHGEMLYVSLGIEQLKPPPQISECVSEANFWTIWRHRGHFSAVTASELIVADPMQFHKVMSIYPKSLLYARTYGLGFVRHVNGLASAQLLDLMRPISFLDGLADEACNVAKDSVRDIDGEVENGVRMSAVPSMVSEAESQGRLSTVSQGILKFSSRNFSGPLRGMFKGITSRGSG